MSDFSQLFDPLKKPAPSAIGTHPAPPEANAPDNAAQPPAHVVSADDYFAFHLFAARFPNQAEAEGFTFEHWEPQPAAHASAAEFSAWEARNPSWRLKQELGYFMDADFVELIDREDGPHYLESLIRSDADQQQLRRRIDPGYSHYILVGSESIHGDQRSDAPGPNQRPPENTTTLDYLGEFNHSSAPR